MDDQLPPPPPIDGSTVDVGNVDEATAEAVAAAVAAVANGAALGTLDPVPDETAAAVATAAATAAAAASEQAVASRRGSSSHPTWDARFAQLRAFRDEHGHTNVPGKYAANPQLATWVSEQRRLYKVLNKDTNPNPKSNLTEERIALLDGIGFQWSVQLSSWDKRFRELCDYKDEFGSCNVPNKWKRNPSLGKWVNAQRQYYRSVAEGKKTSLSHDRIERLESLGFVWSLRELTPWETRLEELKKYKEQHGHVVVPQKDKDQPALARWVDTQRQQHKLFRAGKPSQITAERVAKLDALGMKWAVSDPDSWSKRYQELIEYRAHNGDCNVPMRKDNPVLGEWVGQQRKHYKIRQAGKGGPMSDERLEKLEAIGFTWSLRKKRKSSTTTTKEQAEDEADQKKQASKKKTAKRARQDKKKETKEKTKSSEEDEQLKAAVSDHVIADLVDVPPQGADVEAQQVEV